MWIFTSGGFVSAVYTNGVIQVRGRDRLSLVSIAKAAGTEVICTQLADYPYRVATDKQTLAQWLQDEVLKMDYPNYKSEAFRVRGIQFARPLHDVWETMHFIEDIEARPREQRAK